VTDRRIPRPGLSREHVDQLVERVGRLGADPRVERPPPREITKVGRPAPPANPPSVAPSLETTQESPPEPRRHSPPPFESPAVQAAAERALRRHGERVEPVPESSVAPLPRPASEPPTPSRRPRDRLGALLDSPLGKALGALLLAAVGGGAATAGRDAVAPAEPPSVAQLRADLAAARVEAARLTLTTQQLDARLSTTERQLDDARARLSRQQERIEDHEGQIQALRRSVPTITGLPH
jgi:hypothetical protein